MGDQLGPGFSLLDIPRLYVVQIVQNYIGVSVLSSFA